MNTKIATHTKGPWHHDATWDLIKSNKKGIAALHSENLADARLIAAAPDLLAACKLALEEGDDYIAIKAIKAAIAKAEGREE